MYGLAYLFRKGKLDPISSTEVEIRDDVNEDQAVLMAAHVLMKEYRVELHLEGGKNEVVRRKIPGIVKKKGPADKRKTSR